MSSEQLLLALMRLGIGHSAIVETEDIDWNRIKVLSEQQGLSAIVLDGTEELKKRFSSVTMPEKKFLTHWIGEVLQGYEHRYELYRRSIAELAGFYNSHVCKMMVLKGYACSMSWPKPEHRPVGDIDLWQFGEYKKADALLASEKGIEVDRSHHHHTVFKWHGFMVENHYDFINVHHHKSNVGLEKELKRLGEDDTYFVEIDGAKVYIPSPNLHALFLLKHTMNDFTSSSMTLRQVLDWAFHVQRYEKEIDWEWLKEIMDQYHMTDFFNCINAICVEELGFDANIFHGSKCDAALKARVLRDILDPEYSRSEPEGIIRRLFYKYKRWKANEWKHKLCYNESMWSAFWSGVWSHLLKPSSF